LIYYFPEQVKNYHITCLFNHNNLLGDAIMALKTLSRKKPAATSSTGVKTLKRPVKKEEIEEQVEDIEEVEDDVEEVDTEEADVEEEETEDEVEESDDEEDSAAEEEVEEDDSEDDEEVEEVPKRAAKKPATTKSAPKKPTTTTAKKPATKTNSTEFSLFNKQVKQSRELKEGMTVTRDELIDLYAAELGCNKATAEKAIKAFETVLTEQVFP
jgi:archaellum component FlaD/FlaE